jgi:hypothetical protein
MPPGAPLRAVASEVTNLAGPNHSEVSAPDSSPRVVP